MRRYASRFSLAAGLLASLAASGFAQQQPSPAEQRQDERDLPRVGGRMGRRQMGREGRVGNPRAEGRVLRRLNLSDAQREQLRGIESRYAESFRAKREELRAVRGVRREGGTLTAEQRERARRIREELRAVSGKMREEIRALLTEEQRNQLQSARDELRQRREGRLQRRGEPGERRRQRRPAPPTGIGQF